MDNHAALRANVGLLGQLLGDAIRDHHGQAFLDKIETIRQLAKSARQGNDEDQQRLLTTLKQLSDDELLPVARAFSQFLNLANVAEQFHTISRGYRQDAGPSPLDQVFERLRTANVGEAAIREAVAALDIDLVLTAHPTEVTRRTFIHKHVQLNDCLAALELELPEEEKAGLLARVDQLITQAWHSNEIRAQRPTPVDEAKWGFAVIENSLWPALPRFLRQLDQRLENELGERLPLDAAPVRFTSWMGGDRDGNPFVTAKVTEEVLLLGRWMASSLFLADIQELVSELSMSEANTELRAASGDSDEPYRAVLRVLREELRETLLHLNARVQGQKTDARDLITQTEQLRQPLELCYRSLQQCGLGKIADGLLLDVIRKAACFGIHLLKLDIRQDGERHTQALAEITRYLGLGDYAEWSEADKQAFLLNELNSRRPLLPRQWQPSADTQEVLDTCGVIARHPRDAFGIYIISMAGEPSDVLAVQLLLKECGVDFPLPVAPLFETLDDLNQGAAVIERLYQLPWYRGYMQGRQYVMIGYSDSAKDAGMLAAGWAQYSAMEKLVAISARENVTLTLFHGRGGSLGRGGGPARQAILAQPPGSTLGGLRVTEQGEMIRFKFGLPQVAIDSLALYASAVLEANLLPPPEPEPEWRTLMNSMAEVSCAHYRSLIRGEPDFVPYFRAATPELELGKLPLGSRPAKRKPDGGVESLRAIPWIFAWTQNRLMLPAWLGAHKGLEQVMEDGHEATLRAMNKGWPFFRARLDMLEMVFLKADLGLAAYYDSVLVPEKLKPLGKRLRDELRASTELVLQLKEKSELLSSEPWIQESIKLRNPYTDPLNVLQAELLKRSREQGDIHPVLDQALMVTIAGIAAGMRNTG
ncbi:phosphoenolpyruvate carboxylase [Oceanimonas sp. GK1]|uniref:phosphoenolpyruvate carboxylase n=1 Tax=Oceanimonas sp. (strain GK1 / IBRC-M 10197) TaxID=511062 RepID=UPI0002494DAF|nr:phosphoenolpyruvate carboxylase [Oceanimonas sp. GK1]AEX99955.1 phosphoenolpyruvate carboxylase [Oceanimonas sp. GK1]